MSDNFQFKDSTGATRIARATDLGSGILSTHHTTDPGESWIGSVGQPYNDVSANFTRPADTTAYASGDLVANSVTAASVTPMAFACARVAAGSFNLRRARLKKSAVTVTLATFRLHIYGSDPSTSTGIANGDNGAWSTNHSTYLGSFDLDMTAATGRVFRDSAAVIAAPSVGSEINVKLASGQTIYGLLEARAGYTPASAEVFTVNLEVILN